VFNDSFTCCFLAYVALGVKWHQKYRNLNSLKTKVNIKARLETWSSTNLTSIRKKRRYYIHLIKAAKRLCRSLQCTRRWLRIIHIFLLLIFWGKYAVLQRGDIMVHDGIQITWLAPMILCNWKNLLTLRLGRFILKTFKTIFFTINFAILRWNELTSCYTSKEQK